MTGRGEAMRGVDDTGAWSTGAERRARQALVGGGLLLLLGLALVGIGPSEVGRAVTVVGLLATIYGIHTFGRLGIEGEDDDGPGREGDPGGPGGPGKASGASGTGSAVSTDKPRAGRGSSKGRGDAG